MCRSHWIYLIILGAIAVAATSALVTVLLLRPDNIDSMDEVAEAASGNTAPEPERPLLQEGSVIAFVPEVICSAQVPGDSWSRLCTAEETAQHGGGACNLVARALLDQVPYADIGIQNAAFCVHDINTTESFTKKDARDFLPFHEMVRTVEVKGSTIGVMLEEVINSLFKTLESKGDYPYASGLRFNVNASASYGNRVTGIEVNERLEKGTWKPINNDGFYTIVGGMLIKGNDPFGAFEFAYRGEQTGKTVTETFIDYAIKARVLENPKPEEFSTQIYIP
jgi:5'-nucleotidase